MHHQFAKSWKRLKRSVRPSGASASMPHGWALDAAALEDRVMFSAAPMVDVMVDPNEAAGPIDSLEQIAQADEALFAGQYDSQDTDEAAFSDALSDAGIAAEDDQIAAADRKPAHAAAGLVLERLNPHGREIGIAAGDAVIEIDPLAHGQSLISAALSGGRRHSS